MIHLESRYHSHLKCPCVNIRCEFVRIARLANSTTQVLWESFTRFTAAILGKAERFPRTMAKIASQIDCHGRAHKHGKQQVDQSRSVENGQVCKFFLSVDMFAGLNSLNPGNQTKPCVIQQTTAHVFTMSLTSRQLRCARFPCRTQANRVVHIPNIG